MKKTLLSSLLFIPFIGFGQTSWTYNFDNAAATASYSTVSGESTTFLPTTQTNGGTARVRIGSGSGSFNLTNPGTSLGSNYELNGIAPSGTSINKFVIQNYTAAKIFSTSFNVRFDGGASGIWYFFEGSGLTYTGNSGFSSAQVFTGLRFNFGASNSIVTSRRDASGWNSTAISEINSQATNYLVEIFGNNSTSSGIYTKGVSQSLAPNTWDLWINGVLIGDDLAKATLPNDSNIDSFMFYGESSTLNVATIYIDNIAYTSTSLITLPISLTSFTGKAVDKSVLLNWETASESNNDYFEVLKSSNGKSFTSAGILKGSGTTTSAKSYSLVDNNPAAGTNYYQLVQYDFDGKSSKSDAIPVNSSIANSSLTVYAAATSVNVSINSANATDGTLQIFDITGKKLNETKLSLTKGFNTLSLPLSLNSGIHVINFITSAEIINSKFIKD